MSKIMLVEDDNNLREIYGERLMAEGYEIVSASNGEEALAMAVKERPDLIISDVMMPKISGFDMLDILRQTPETKNTKIIMMTALSQLDDKARADRLGADKYLVKSQVTLEDVARVVHDILNGPEAPAMPAPSIPVTPTITPVAPIVPEPISTMPSATTQPVAVPTPIVTAPEPAANPAVAQSTVTPITFTPQPVTPIPEPFVVPTAGSKPINPVHPTASTATSPADQLSTQPTPAEPILATPIMPTPTITPVAPIVPEPISTMPSATTQPVAVPTPIVTAPEPAANPDKSTSGDTAATTVANQEATVTQAAPQSVEQEVTAVAEQIESFLHSNDIPEAVQAPIIDPTTITPTETPATAPVTGKNIHVETSDIIPPAPAKIIASPLREQPEATNDSKPLDDTTPGLQDPTSGNPTDVPSQHKKVIAPIHDSSTPEPSIYDLYEKEMAEEAASAPADDAVVIKSTNPLTAESPNNTPPPLETLDPSQLNGVQLEPESTDPEIVKVPPLPPAEPTDTTTTANQTEPSTVPSATPDAATPTATSTPVPPTSFTSSAGNPGNIAL